MENQRPVVCPENEDLATYIWKKKQEMAESNDISDRLDLTLYKAYCSVCSSKNPIKTLKELSKVKGVGQWTLRIMKGFFPTDSASSPSKELAVKKTKGPKRYVPQKNSVAYALLITLYRERSTGSHFMLKQQLIDAVEASGLSRVPIAPEKGKGKVTQFGSSPREWYSGWSCMKTLITKGLIVKSSCPAKYMLTQEGEEAARECLLRSGLADPLVISSNNEVPRSQDVQDLQFMETGHTSLGKDAISPSKGLIRSRSSVKMPVDSLERLSFNHKSEEPIYFMEDPELFPAKRKKSSVSTRQIKSFSSNVISPHQQEHVNLSNLDSGQDFVVLTDETCITQLSYGEHRRHLEPSCSAISESTSFSLHTCSSSTYPVKKSFNMDHCERSTNTLAMPPKRFKEKFEDEYDVVLILDDREQFVRGKRGSRSKKFIDNICSQFNVQVEIRRLPVGDGIWIARKKVFDKEYVLDFIVERKEVDDLCGSIRDNRYRDQKLRLLRCGLQKLIYLVEGDPNSCEASESIKTACFTTEILEGFDVQRTSCLTDTLKKYCHLTGAIRQYYKAKFDDTYENSKICPLFDEFVRKCHYLDKMTVSDVFGIQLMQVPQVTEEVANAVLGLYPTLLSLARAYCLLEGDLRAQEEMLGRQSSVIGAAASRNIFKLVWGS